MYRELYVFHAPIFTLEGIWDIIRARIPTHHARERYWALARCAGTTQNRPYRACEYRATQDDAGWWTEWYLSHLPEELR